MMQKLKNHTQPRGQAFVMLLVFTAVATILLSAAVSLTITNSQSTAKVALGEETLHYAEAGADEAILRIVKDPSYTTTNQSITIGNGSVLITVSGAPASKTIVSEGLGPNYSRKIQVTGSYANGVFTIATWGEM